MPAEPESGADGRTFGTAGRAAGTLPDGEGGGFVAVRVFRSCGAGACGRDIAGWCGGRASSGDAPSAGTNFSRGMQDGMRIAAVKANV